MKQYKIFSAIIVCLLIASNSFARAETELKDTIEETFKVNGETQLMISNSFGKVEVTNWDKSEFYVLVEIVVEGNNEQRAQKMLDEIDIDYGESGDQVYFKTRIGNMKNKNGESFEVNYTIKMPSENDVDIKNTFGDLYLSDREGSAEIEVAYGALKAESLLGRSEVEISFGKGDLDKVAKGEFVIKYSSLEVGEVEIMEMDAQFSDIEIEKVGSMELEAKYGGLELGTVQDLEVEASFNAFTIAELTGSLILDASYVSDFEIEEVKATFTKIDIQGKFSSYELNLTEEVMADLHAMFEFSDLKTSGLEIEYTLKVRDNNENEYRGKINGGSSDRKIFIDSSYGSCKIYQ